MIRMQGEDRRSGGMFSYVSLEARVPADRPLRPIRAIVDDALSVLSGELGALYSHLGRPSIPPERLLRALLLRAFYSVRSERLLIRRDSPESRPVRQTTPAPASGGGLAAVPLFGPCRGEGGRTAQVVPGGSDPTVGALEETPERVGLDGRRGDVIGAVYRIGGAVLGLWRRAGGPSFRW
jgi:hypothetical protein